MLWSVAVLPWSQNLRNTQIILDRDLAELYGVETRVLNQAITRNIERFPIEFRFQLTTEEFEILKMKASPNAYELIKKYEK